MEFLLTLFTEPPRGGTLFPLTGAGAGGDLVEAPFTPFQKGGATSPSSWRMIWYRRTTQNTPTHQRRRRSCWKRSVRLLKYRRWRGIWKRGTSDLWEGIDLGEHTVAFKRDGLQEMDQVLWYIAKLGEANCPVYIYS